MLTLEPLHDLTLEVYEPQELDTELSVKNYLLFSELDGKIVAFVSEKYLTQASTYYTKLHTNYELQMLDEDSYDRLYNRFLELRTDKTMETM